MINSIIDTITSSNTIFFSILGVLVVIIIVMIILIRNENKKKVVEDEPVKTVAPMEKHSDEIDKVRVLESDEITDTVVMPESMLSNPIFKKQSMDAEAAKGEEVVSTPTSNGIQPIAEEITREEASFVDAAEEKAEADMGLNVLSSIAPNMDEEYNPVPGSIGDAEDKDLVNQIDSFFPDKVVEEANEDLEAKIDAFIPNIVTNNDEAIDEEIEAPEIKVEEPVVEEVKEEKVKPNLDEILNIIGQYSNKPKKENKELEIEAPTLAETMALMREEKEISELSEANEDLEAKIDAPTLAETLEKMHESVNVEEEEEEPVPVIEEEEEDTFGEDIPEEEEPEEEEPKDLEIIAPTLAETLEKMHESVDVEEEEEEPEKEEVEEEVEKPTIVSEGLFDNRKTLRPVGLVEEIPEYKSETQYTSTIPIVDFDDNGEIIVPDVEEVEPEEEEEIIVPTIEKVEEPEVEEVEEEEVPEEKEEPTIEESMEKLKAERESNLEIDAPTLAETMVAMRVKTLPSDIELPSYKGEDALMNVTMVEPDPGEDDALMDVRIEEPDPGEDDALMDVRLEEVDDGYYDYDEDNDDEVEGITLSELSGEKVTDDNLRELTDKLSNLEPKVADMTPYEVEQEEKAIISYDELVKQNDNVSIEYQDMDKPNPDVDIKQVDLEKTGRIELDPIKKALNSKVENNQYEHEEEFLDALKGLLD